MRQCRSPRTIETEVVFGTYADPPYLSLMTFVRYLALLRLPLVERFFSPPRTACRYCGAVGAEQDTGVTQGLDYFCSHECRTSYADALENWDSPPY
jgi:hypothetical protein